MLGQDYFLNVAFVQIYPLLVISHQGPKCGELVYLDRNFECRLCKTRMFFNEDIKIYQGYFPLQSLSDIELFMLTIKYLSLTDLRLFALTENFRPITAVHELWVRKPRLHLKTEHTYAS